MQAVFRSLDSTGRTTGTGCRWTQEPPSGAPRNRSNLAPTDPRLAINFQGRQGFSEFPHALVGSRCAQDAERLQTLESAHLLQSGISDLGFIKIEPLQLVQPAKLLHTGVSDLGTAEIECRQVLETTEFLQTHVGDVGRAEAEER